MKNYLLKRISPEETYEDLLSFPRYFEIETVNACNARCPMCTIDDWDRRNGLMEDDLFEKIALEIGKHPEVKRVHLYRDGEPLLDKHLSEKVARLKGLGVKRVGISTNVELLNSITSKRLLTAGLDEIILSIDSLDINVYEKIRVGCHFNTVMANALNFILLRDAMKSSCQIWVRMIRQELNYREWDEYEKNWKSLLKSSDRVDFRMIHNWGSQLKDFKPVSKTSTDKPCVALWSLMVIFADGSVPMCNVDYNKKYPLGSVKESSIEALWQSRIQNERRGIHLTDRGALSLCKNCTVWDN
jgi:radical SAM protein with 4Fe4S-binding SPASM domain